MSGTTDRLLYQRSVAWWEETQGRMADLEAKVACDTYHVYSRTLPRRRLHQIYVQASERTVHASRFALTASQQNSAWSKTAVREGGYISPFLFGMTRLPSSFRVLVLHQSSRLLLGPSAKQPDFCSTPWRCSMHRSSCHFYPSAHDQGR